MDIVAQDVYRCEALPDGERVEITFKEKGGKMVKLTIGCLVLSEVASIGQKALLRRHQVYTHGPGGAMGALKSIPVSDAQKWEVGQLPMFQPPAVYAAFDLGNECQLAYRLTPEDARALAEALLKAAGQR